MLYFKDSKYGKFNYICRGNNIFDNSLSPEDDELDGIFDSPEDDPTSWLCMLKLRVDESIEDTTGMCFVAGFLGNSGQWKEYVKRWREARHPYESLHFADMRLGSPQAPQRWGALLGRLGAIPKECGLRPVAGSIRTSDYRDHVAGTALQVLMEGYVLAIIALLDGLLTQLPSGERFEVLFEENIIHAELRERAMIFWRKRHRTPAGWSVLAGWGSRPKGILTEASDYLCYALQQFYVDPESQKAKLTAPILDDFPFGNHVSKATVDRWLRQIAASRPRPIPALTPKIKKSIRDETFRGIR